jgi:hypothetical protein
VSAWIRAFCESGGCVEVVAIGEDTVALRSTLAPQDVLRITREEWDALVVAVKGGVFDEVERPAARALAVATLDALGHGVGLGSVGATCGGHVETGAWRAASAAAKAAWMDCAEGHMSISIERHA